MATEAQIIANRRNSQKSTGPRSPEGKAIVSKNAVKHGLFASENVIKGENQADFDLFHDGRMQNQAIDVMIERDGPSPLTKQLRLSLPKFLRDVQDDPRGSGPELVLGRAAIKDYSNSRVLDRLLMYERRIENSMIKMMDQLLKLRLMREMEKANAGEEDPGAPGEVNLKKQSQSAPDQIGANSYVGEKYENKPRPGLPENKVKQSQSPAFGRKSEALNPKSETSRMEYSVKNLSPDIISKICR
jgi:hypothetical protein